MSAIVRRAPSDAPLIGDIDGALWNTLPLLAPGQAVVSFTSLTRPLLVAVDPTPCKLLMIE